MTQSLAHALESAHAARTALARTRRDRWYPTFHIAAPAGWINDPNGVVTMNGVTHVFYQHNPAAAQWGPMHWGHVTTRDLVHFTHAPIALAPSLEADRDGVFSGSAVIDDEGVMTVLYTGNVFVNGHDEQSGLRQVQCLATSTDGFHFDKVGEVIPRPGDVDHSRDPKVFRVGDTWYLVIGVAAQSGRGQVHLYRSDDLRHWTSEGVLFEDPNPDVFMLECPDFFPLDGRWVLAYSPMGLRPDGYANRNSHNSGYVVGSWQPGEEFVPATEYRPLDWGHNFYAPQSFEYEGRRVQWAWMGAFDRPSVTEADGWNGQLIVPRELHVVDDRVVALPVAEADSLHGAMVTEDDQVVPEDGTLTLWEDAGPADITLDIDRTRTSATRVSLLVGLTADGHCTRVGWDAQADRVFIDRGDVGAGRRGYRSAPCPEGDVLRLRVLVDRGSIEVFAGDGEATVSSFAFPAAGQQRLALRSEEGPAAVSWQVHEMTSAIV
ncbi:MAG: glycoside hydrolase family 32 protein [Actinomycetaceae bacterium]|nr:glycoside hydrolase family 32 protein [Actinomycetaceae bacterium]MDU0969657.1 glycoside hydrolase family 32 protein [Actinomycetaceae bacterium]